MTSTNLLSTNSSAAGKIPAAMISETVRAASSTRSNDASAVQRAEGIGIKLSTARVTTPRMPSDPIVTPSRSTSSSSLNVTRRPSARTTSSASTWWNVTPYLIHPGPPAFSAMLPPIVEIGVDAGSGA